MLPLYRKVAAIVIQLRRCGFSGAVIGVHLIEDILSAVSYRPLVGAARDADRTKIGQLGHRAFINARPGCGDGWSLDDAFSNGGISNHTSLIDGKVPALLHIIHYQLKLSI